VSLIREIELATQMRVKVESVTAYVYKLLKRDSDIVRPPFCVAVIGLQTKTRGSFTLLSNKMNCRFDVAQLPVAKEFYTNLLPCGCSRTGRRVSSVAGFLARESIDYRWWLDSVLASIR
jgi:hypothetical protein